MVYLFQILQHVMLATFITTSAFAAPVPTDQVDSGAITVQSAGLWFNPHHDGEGFSIQVSDSPNADKVFTVTWYTYDNQRQQMWLIGTQSFSQGDTSVTVALLRPTGTRFGNNFTSEDVNKEVWGLVTFDFLSCNEATATINTSTGFGTGVIPLNKLTDNSGANCTNMATVADPPFYSDAGGVPVPPAQQGLGEGIITSRGDHSVDGIRINSERLFIDNRQCIIEANLTNETNTNRSLKLVYYFYLENKQVAFALFEQNFDVGQELTANQKILSISSPDVINCNAFDEVRIESLAAQATP